MSFESRGKRVQEVHLPYLQYLKVENRPPQGKVLWRLAKINIGQLLLQTNLAAVRTYT